jgi:hypothetical protein
MASEVSAAPRFFVLDDEYKGNFDTEFTRVDEDDDNVGEASRCPRCGSFISMLPWLPPYRVTLERYGKELGDFMRGFGNNLISERFADALRVEGFTGFQGFHPVEVVRVRRQRRGARSPLVPRYLLVTPVFGSAAVDEAHSRIRRSSPISCDWCRSAGVEAVHGFALEPESWKGDDVFFARGLPGTIIVSERFAHFVTRHGFTNMRLIPTEEYTWDPLAPRPPNPTPVGQTQG